MGIYATACIRHYINCKNTVLYRNRYSNIQNIYRNSCTVLHCYILADSYQVNKREYWLRYSWSPYTMIYWKVIQKIYRKILFCIQPYSVRIRENTVQKNPYSRWFYVAQPKKQGAKQILRLNNNITRKASSRLN